jgi:ketosteroid isomerase-like protein
MPAHKPEDLDRLFEAALNRGDLDALVALYEPGAAMPEQSGNVAVGTDALRQSIGQFVAMKPQIDLQVEKVVQAGDVALVYSKWTMDAGGQKMEGKGREVTRRQPDGTWKYLIDDPFGGGQ